MGKVSAVNIEDKGWIGFIQVCEKQRFLKTTTEIVVQLKRKSPDRAESQFHRITKERLHDVSYDTTHTISGALSLGRYKIIRPTEIGADGNMVGVEAKTVHEEFNSLSGDIEYLWAKKNGFGWGVHELHKYRNFYAAGTKEKDVLKKIDSALGIGLPNYFDKAMEELERVS